MKARHFLFILFLFSLSTSLWSQGGWNIGYVHVDSIVQDHIGKHFKLDFKHVWETVRPNKRWIRSFVTPIDTVELEFGERKIEFVEKRKIYVDQGFIDDQHIESLQDNPDRITRLLGCTIMELAPEKIKFEILVKEYTVAKDKLIRSYIKTIWIEKSSLDGLMYEQE